MNPSPKNRPSQKGMPSLQNHHAFFRGKPLVLRGLQTHPVTCGCYKSALQVRSRWANSALFLAKKDPPLPPGKIR